MVCLIKLEVVNDVVMIAVETNGEK